MSETLENAMAKLDRHKHWTVRCVNRAGHRRRYECTIWGEGKRVSATAMHPLMAINAAEHKLKCAAGFNLKVVST